MLQSILQSVVSAWPIWLCVLLFAAFLVLLAAALLSRFSGEKQPPARPDIQPEIVDALTVYLGGNGDSRRLRALAKAHPEKVLETILQYQAAVAGRRDELGELTVALGYVQTWWYDAQSPKVLERRKAFCRMASVAHSEPVRRVVGDVAVKAIADKDEEIRLHAARILLASSEPAAITRVFEGALSDTPAIRSALAGELSRHAIQLCEAAIPRALRALNPLGALQMLVSWERALPLLDVRPLAEHRDPLVRLEVMRLLPYLPATPENREAILVGLDDENHHVSEAAEAAVQLSFPKPGANPPHAPVVLSPLLENA